MLSILLCYVVFVVLLLALSPKLRAELTSKRVSTAGLAASVPVGATLAQAPLLSEAGAFVLDDELRHVEDLPSCDDADLGFGEDATLREVVARSRWARTAGLGPLAFGVPPAQFKPEPPPEEFALQLAQLRENRYFVAALLHENRKVLTWWNRELVKVLLALGNAKMDNLFVSVLESNSADMTSIMVDALAELLRHLGVPSRILVGHSGPRAEGRITFLARLRNEVLRPLLDLEAAAERAGGQGPGERLPFSHVLFLNDVYACGRGIVELLWHLRARRSPAAEAEAAVTAAARERALGGAEGSGGQQRARPEGALGSEAEAAAGRSLPPWAWEYDVADMACSVDYTSQLNLYDKWAGHDIMGHALLNAHPYVRHMPSATAFAAGEPFQVHTCWNGLVAFRADAVVRKGLRFRRNVPLECAASECDLWCRDMWSVGMGRILMVPRLKVAYSLLHFQELRQLLREPGGEVLRWSTASADVQLSRSAPTSVRCCPIGNSSAAHLVDWRECLEDAQWQLLYTLWGTPAAPSPLLLTADSALSALLAKPSATVSSLVRAVREAAAAAAPATSQVGEDAGLGVERLGKLQQGAGLLEAAELLREHRDCSARRAGAQAAAEAPAAAADVMGDGLPEAEDSDRIPSRIVQLGPSELLHDLPISALWSVVSWVWQHPCHDYVYLSYASAAQALTPLYEPLRAATERPHVSELVDESVRWALMHRLGGIYASLDSTPTRSWLGLVQQCNGHTSQLVTSPLVTSQLVTSQLVLGKSVCIGSRRQAELNSPRSLETSAELFAIRARHPLALSMLQATLRALLHESRLQLSTAPADRGSLSGGARPLNQTELVAGRKLELAQLFVSQAAPHLRQAQGSSANASIACLLPCGALFGVTADDERSPKAEPREPGVTQPWALLLPLSPAARLGYGRLRSVGYDCLRSQPKLPRTGYAGLPARSYLYGIDRLAREQLVGAQRAEQPVWTAERWLSPRQALRMDAYAKAHAKVGRGCFFELQASGTIAVFEGERPADPSARLLYSLEAREPLAWPELPVLSLSHTGSLALHSHVLCAGVCEGGRGALTTAPPEGIDQIRLHWALNVSARGPHTALDDLRLCADCARHVLVLRREDAVLAVLCGGSAEQAL